MAKSIRISAAERVTLLDAYWILERISEAASAADARNIHARADRGATEIDKLFDTATYDAPTGDFWLKN